MGSYSLCVCTCARVREREPELQHTPFTCRSAKLCPVNVVLAFHDGKKQLNRIQAVDRLNWLELTQVKKRIEEEVHWQRKSSEIFPSLIQPGQESKRDTSHELHVAIDTIPI